MTKEEKLELYDTRTRYLNDLKYIGNLHYSNLQECTEYIKVLKKHIMNKLKEIDKLLEL